MAKKEFLETVGTRVLYRHVYYLNLGLGGASISKNLNLSNKTSETRFLHVNTYLQ